MRLLEVNGVSLLGASHQEAVNSLRCSGNVIKLLICDGYDAAEVERLQLEGKLARDTKSTSDSVSSLDRVGVDNPFKAGYHEEDGSCDREDVPLNARSAASLPVSPTLGDRGQAPATEKVCSHSLLILYETTIQISLLIFRCWTPYEQPRCLSLT